MSAAAHTPKSELFWRPDPNVDAARKLPEWVEFHRICGRQSLCFDHIERDGRRGQYTAQAMMIERSGGGYQYRLLATGRGADVLASLSAAYEAAGVDVPGAAEMLSRGLLGAPRVRPADTFEELFA